MRRGRLDTGARAAIVGSLVLIAACPQTMEIPQNERLPDAAVAPYTAQPACRHEPREISLLPHVEGDLLARLVRTDEGAMLVRAEPGTAGAPLKLRLEAVSRDGSTTPVGTPIETGASGSALGLDAVLGGSDVVVAVTRPERRIELVTISLDGTSASPAKTVTAPADGIARLVWLKGTPIVLVGGSLLRDDGTKMLLGSETPPPSDAGPAEDGGATPDSGVSKAIAIPDGLTSVVAAGDTLGWLRSDEQATWLEHALVDQGMILSARVAPAGHEDVRLLWAGDRYIVGDSDGADIARYVVARPRASGSRGTWRLDLGGRMVLPRPPSGVRWTAWDNTGARHLGMAQLIGPRHLQFLNAALSGMILDAPIHIRRERDVVAADVVWDGHGYLLAWTERNDASTDQLLVTRFSCPDES